MAKSTTIPKLPVTKFHIMASDLIDAARGNSFRQTDWFYRKKGKDIRPLGKFFSNYLEDERDYIVLEDTTCFSLEENNIRLGGLRRSGYQPAFIFVNCALPMISLADVETGDWVFIHTNVNGVFHAEGNSRIGDIRIEADSYIDSLYIRGSTCEDILISDNSLTGSIIIFKDSKCGHIDVDDHSHCENITIHRRSSCGSINLRFESSAEDINVRNGSEIGDIEVDSNSQTGDIAICDKSKYEDISIENNSRCRNILIENTTEGGNIRIYNNSRCRDFSLKHTSKCGSISIGKDSQVRNVLLENESQSGNIRFLQNSFCGTIHIREKSRSGDIWVNYASLCEAIYVGLGSQAGILRILSGQCNEIGIYNNSKAKHIEVIRNALSGLIAVRDNSEVDMLMINERSRSGGITIDEGKVNRILIAHDFCSIVLRSAAISVMEINSCYLNQLVWGAGTKVELYIDECTINHFQLYKTSLLKDAIVSIINSEIHIIQLQELLAHGQLVLRNIEAFSQPFIGLQKPMGLLVKGGMIAEKVIHHAGRELIKKHVITYHQQLILLNDHPALKGHIKPLFRIVGTSLGKTEITGSDLTGFHFEYRDSKLLEVFINGTQLPKEKIDIYNESPESSLPDKIFFEQKVSVYNQLKRIFENQGDIVEGTWYHSKAMANQQRLLSLHFHERSGKWWSEEAFDLFNFKLNKISNNHGESWRKALCFSICVLFTIYSLYFVSVNGNRPFSWSGIDSFIGNFFSFLDITHKIDFMVDKDKLNGFAKFLDFFGRAATGYCIYQFIAAFRRHGKKG